jgi:hypothetical protein
MSTFGSGSRALVATITADTYKRKLIQSFKMNTEGILARRMIQWMDAFHIMRGDKLTHLITTFKKI